MSLDETYSRVCIGKNLFEKFYIKNGLKQEDTLSPLLFNSTVQYISTVYIFSSSVITLHFFVSLSLLHLHFDSIVLYKGDIINSKIRENNTMQVNTAKA
jgi:hypothetical protein